MVRSTESLPSSEVAAPGLLTANTVGAIGLAILTTLALAKGYNGIAGTLWMLALAGTMALTATYASRGRGKKMFACVLLANGIWTSICLLELIVLPTSGLIVLFQGLWTATNLIRLLSVLPIARPEGDVKNG